MADNYIDEEDIRIIREFIDSCFDCGLSKGGIEKAISFILDSVRRRTIIRGKKFNSDFSEKMKDKFIKELDDIEKFGNGEYDDLILNKMKSSLMKNMKISDEKKISESN